MPYPPPAAPSPLSTNFILNEVSWVSQGLNSIQTLDRGGEMWIYGVITGKSYRGVPRNLSGWRGGGGVSAPVARWGLKPFGNH